MNLLSETSAATMQDYQIILMQKEVRFCKLLSKIMIIITFTINITISNTNIIVHVSMFVVLYLKLSYRHFSLILTNSLPPKTNTGIPPLYYFFRWVLLAVS